ncbi:hypothetical protein QWY86_16225 [Pedobacter aquatilis]|uniref:hypothetical protein n=1 Tax=Pedobacter aquatilis TaxID=351343 RepID=UPI0025B2BE70|nr:hypothetical protein [Pedobacter aquatilis]MDN3588232.1 hypothetical protein [Pedobacter aquatilis]
MNTIKTFKESIEADAIPKGISLQLKALWYDGKGDWEKAHALVDQLTDSSSALIHAYLHRKEGDIWNADYWYSRAKSARPNVTLNEEWEILVEQFLKD